MGRISAAFRRLKKGNEAALVPYLTVGYPSLEATRQLLPVIARQGADMIELGVPFSDPLADGATIQRTSQVALENGVSLADCLRVAAEARRSNEVPLLLMSYYNPLLRYGLDALAEDCAEAGVDGLIVPDLPPDEAAELKGELDGKGVDLIFLLAPTSTDERIRRVAEMASGFIYCVSLTGVTGARSEVSSGLSDFLARVRSHTDLPLVVGFGISTPEQVEHVSGIADGVVVASALMNHIEGLPEDELVIGVSEFVRALKERTALGVRE
ncbi:MAG TPA: tryptophan synthase subunit alpha [Chloroflexia bacterium]|nr:tryptophan synthase subunit alpha [Chloroflexia bacterium]